MRIPGEWLAIAAIAISAPSLAQQAPVQQLRPEFVELPYELSYAGNISGIVELRDGRTIMADQSNANAILIVDWGAKTTRMLGGHGRGPGEYIFVGNVLPFGGDSALVWATGLRVVDAQRVSEPVANSLYNQLSSKLQSIDLRGRRLELHAFAFRSRGQGRAPLKVLLAGESLHVVIRTPGRTRPDTLARIRGFFKHYVERPMEVKPGQFMRASIGSQLVAEEQAMIFPDGWVAIAYRTPYRVDWYDPSRRVVRGSPLPFDSVAVDKEQKRASLSSWLPHVPTLREDDLPDWPKVLPAYVADALMQMPDGQLLIARTNDVKARDARYDIVDRQGKLTGVLVVPKNVLVLGVSAKYWYVAVTDADDVPHLRRYPR